MSIPVKNLKGPKGYPIVGMGPKMDLPNLHNQIQGWTKDYGDIFKLDLGLVKMTVVTRPAIIQHILKNRPHQFIRMGKLDKVLQEQDVLGVFNAERDDWKVHRKMVAKGLDVKHQQHFFPWMKHTTEVLMNKWKKQISQNERFDVQQDFLRYTVDVTTNLAFGYKMNTLEEEGGAIQEHLARIFPTIFNRINAPIPWYKLRRSKTDKEFDISIKVINEFLDDLIAKATIRLIENPEKKESPENFLEAILVDLETEDNFSNQDVRSNLITILMAGEDTTAHTLAWALFILNDHPEVVEKLRKEADEILGDNTILQDYSDLPKLKYTEAVINEVMRLKPIAPIFLFEPTEDVEIEGFSFPKGSRILTQNRAGALQDENFTDAEKFIPERWIKAHPGCPVHNVKAFIPFGAGPRYCPGANLAITEMKLVLSMLTKNFNFKMLTDKEKVKEIMAFTMMASEFEVNLGNREKPRGTR